MPCVLRASSPVAGLHQHLINNTGGDRGEDGCQIACKELSHMAHPCMGTWGEGAWPQLALCVVGRGAALAGRLGSHQGCAQRGLPLGFARFCSPLVVTQWEQSLKKRSEMTIGANPVHLSQPW